MDVYYTLTATAAFFDFWEDTAAVDFCKLDEYPVNSNYYMLMCCEEDLIGASICIFDIWQGIHHSREEFGAVLESWWWVADCQHQIY